MLYSNCNYSLYSLITVFISLYVFIRIFVSDFCSIVFSTLLNMFIRHKGRMTDTAAVKQANKILGMIKCNFMDRSKETILALYKSLVRPYLEYCIPVWNPYLVKDIKLVESAQRRATMMVQGIQHEL